MTPTRGWALRAGDSVLVGGRVRRLTRFVPYPASQVASLGLPDGTRLAYEDDGTRSPWGIAVEPDALFEVVS